MVVNNFLKLRQEIDKLLSSFQIEKAKKLILKIKIDEVPIRMRADFAKLARRANLYKLSVKFLYANIYGGQQPSSEDLLEYASGIRRLGLTNQCHILLERLPESAKRHLYRAFCWVQSWDYGEAQSEFENYLSYSDLQEKERMVAQVNLVSCYLFNGELEKGSDLLAQTVKVCENKYQHLYMNCLELKGRIYLERGEITKACLELDEARHLSSSQVSNTRLFIGKWHLIAQCRSGKLSPQSEEIQQFKSLIRKEQNWETLRSFDWELARISKDFSMINHVYFGTPFKGFREKIKEELWDYHFPSRYIWTDGHPQNSVENAIDFYQIEKLKIPFGMNLHRLLIILASDFYKPWSVERIFNALFPEEIYDPFSSPKKVYRLEEKLRKTIDGSGWPLELQSTINGYRLRLKEGGFGYIHDKMNFLNQENFAYHMLLLSEKREFTLEQVEKVIPISQHQWYRLLKKMEERGLLQSSQLGHRTKYSLKVS